MEGPTFLGKVTGSDPEQFIFITMHQEYTAIKSTSGAMTEEEFRKFTRVNGRHGLTEAEIDLMIENARKHLV